MEQKDLYTPGDGITRCFWSSDDLEMRSYHDHEWGFPVLDDFHLFELISLESFQSGLSWSTILKKRENFREAFEHFDFNKIANFNEDDFDRLVLNKGIVRHRGKIRATINNACRAIEIADEFGSFAAYIWSWEPNIAGSEINSDVDLNPSITENSKLLSKDLKKRGWKFLGATTAYAFMQASGLVNDHKKGCAFREIVEAKRRLFKRP